MPTLHRRSLRRTLVLFSAVAALAALLPAPSGARAAPSAPGADVVPVRGGRPEAQPPTGFRLGGPAPLAAGPVQAFARGGLGGGGAGRGGNTRGPTGRRVGGDRPNGTNGGAGGGADGSGSGSGSSSKRAARAAEREKRAAARDVERCEAEAAKVRATLARHGAARALRAYQRLRKVSRKAGKKGLKIERDVLAAATRAAARELDAAETAIGGLAQPAAALTLSLRDLARALRDTNEELSKRATALYELALARRRE